jgi:hypothetical protein
MARPTPQKITEEIPEDRWIPFFAEFTMENRGAHARLEVIKVEEVGYEVGLEDRPFDGVSADLKGGERNVWMTFGALPGDHFTHGIPRAKIVRSLPPGETIGSVLEVEDKDGTRTVLTLSYPEEFMLPPGERRQ